MKERDEELVQEEMKNVDIKEELIAREQIIKGSFLPGISLAFNSHSPQQITFFFQKNEPS